ncbi:hypothetical protein B0T19DRAFT_443721 [Cercophora scortea]|uniref:Gamma interferon inducible lysosomal thiol reductase n=1 Tax=Cercophora scortea TaxID=314031 RepID=A0AAE0IFY7_9PEZI|nr:hypothetical protein B0T19DRAFT_443721 [Cercophora scortea]
MDEKRARSMSPLRNGRTSRRSRSLLAVMLLGLGLYAYCNVRQLSHIATDRWQCAGESSLSSAAQSDTITTSKPKPVAVSRVPLEAHIMSKCPDAKDCLRQLVLPAMQRVHDKVDFTLSFIGTPTDNDGVACMHGPEECLGNIIELCAQKLYPDPKTFLGFTMCLMKEYKQIPQRSLIEDCALEHAIDFGELNDCATKDDGAFGMGMLRDSVRRSSEVRKQSSRRD